MVEPRDFARWFVTIFCYASLLIVGVVIWHWIGPHIDAIALTVLALCILVIPAIVVWGLLTGSIKVKPVKRQ